MEKYRLFITFSFFFLFCRLFTCQDRKEIKQFNKSYQSLKHSALFIYLFYLFIYLFFYFFSIYTDGL